MTLQTFGAHICPTRLHWRVRKCMSEQIDLLTEALRLIGGDHVVKSVLAALSSRSFLFRQLWRRFVHGRRKSVALGTADIIRKYSGATPLATLAATEHLATLEPGIAIYGLFTAEMGIGQSARRSAQSLRTAGVPISIHNIAMPEAFESKVNFPLNDEFISHYDTALIHLNPDTLLHELLRCPIEALIGRRRIGFWHWELPVYPARWAKAFEKVHEVWAPSTYVARGVAAAADLPVRVVPHAVSGEEVSQARARETLGLPQDVFFFLSIFDLNSFLMRKNPIGIVQAFLDAFPNNGPSSPQLILKCHGRGNRNAVFDELLRRMKNETRIRFIDKVVSNEQIQLMQAACDCYVSLHRSEGFGLNILESMALGKPCIATGFSGNMDFMTSRNSITVPFAMRRVAAAEYPHGEGQWWAEPDHDASVEELRRVAGGAQEVAALGRQARADALEGFSFERVGEISRAAWRGETTGGGAT